MPLHSVAHAVCRPSFSNVSSRILQQRNYHFAHKFVLRALLGHGPVLAFCDISQCSSRLHRSLEWAFHVVREHPIFVAIVYWSFPLQPGWEDFVVTRIFTSFTHRIFQGGQRKSASACDAFFCSTHGKLQSFVHCHHACVHAREHQLRVQAETSHRSPGITTSLTTGR